MITDNGHHRTKFRILLNQPLVCVITIGAGYFTSGIFQCLKAANGSVCHVLVQCYWYVPDMQSTIVNFQKQAIIDFPNLKITYLCNTIGDTHALIAKGVSALHINHNAFLDEKIFYPNISQSKKYSAVHNANLGGYKRHHLAWQVKDIALITYGLDSANPDDALAGYQKVKFINRSDDGAIFALPPSEVRKVLCKSGCGLILSEKEGANFASAEYLLCGIPMVSTASVGGRDAFFDPRHVRIVDDNAEAVAKAVQEWNVSPIDPLEIRASALKKSREHRRRLLGWLCALSNRDLFADCDDNFWSPLFVSKLIGDVDVESNERIVTREPVKSANSVKIHKRIYRGVKLMFGFKTTGVQPCGW